MGVTVGVAVGRLVGTGVAVGKEVGVAGGRGVFVGVEVGIGVSVEVGVGVSAGSSCADTSVGEVVSSGFCACAVVGVIMTNTARIVIGHKAKLSIHFAFTHRFAGLRS
jgi:hypothetical protein